MKKITGEIERQRQKITGERRKKNCPWIAESDAPWDIQCVLFIQKASSLYRLCSLCIECVLSLYRKQNTAAHGALSRRCAHALRQSACICTYTIVSYYTRTHTQSESESERESERERSFREHALGHSLSAFRV